MKRIMTIQDISCVGKCSITVALPIISAMGTETVILPTAVLSTHTMYPDCTKKNIEDQMLPISAHWHSLHLTFDAIYTGYLASTRQIDLVRQIFKTFDDNRPLRFVDPAMADNGRLYSGLTPDFPEKMAQLCADADIILPNITEACLMTGTPYRTSFEENELRDLLISLSKLGTRKAIVLTGAGLGEGQTGIYGMHTTSGRFFHFSHKQL